MSEILRTHIPRSGRAIGRTGACLAVLIGLALGEAHATIGVQEETAPPSRSPLDAVQQVVSNTLQAIESLGLVVDPVQARERVREAVLTVADPGAVLLTQDDARLLKARAEGLFYDTGLRVAFTNGFPVVVEVRDGSPAAEAEIQPGWALESLDGQSTSEQQLPDLRRRLCNHEPGETELLFREEDNGTKTVALTKRAGRLPAVEKSEVFPLGLRYLQVNTLSEGAAAEITETLRSWSSEGAFGVVLDLRGAGGADLESVSAIVDLLARPGETLFGFKDAAGKEIKTYRAGDSDPLGMPVMVLVDEETTGAAELLAAAVSGSGRGAMLLGRPTGGDPMIRDRVELPEGEWVYIATRRLVTGGGKVYDGKEGVKPDVTVVLRDQSYRDYEPPPPILTDRRETTEEEKETLKLRIRTRGDVALTRAVDVLLGLKALDIHGFGFEPRPEG